MERHTKDDDERRKLSDSELSNKIKERLEKTNQQRVKSVIYNAILFDKLGDRIDKAKFEIQEVDLLFGTK